MQFKIRPIESGDARGLYAIRIMPGVRENLLSTPAEKYDSCASYVSRMTSDPNEHCFVAVTDDGAGGELVIGQAALSVSCRNRTRHCGSLGLLVHADYQNSGVGTALMSAALDIADNWLMLARTELTVFCDNERAIHLYEKLGFQKEGVRRASAIRGGKYCDEFYMGRLNPNMNL